MADTHDTIDSLLAEFCGYAAGMPPSYHVTMSWHDFRRMLDRFDAAQKRERGDCAKLREALCDIVMLTMKVGHSIRGDVACGIIASKAKHALKQPPRNCDIGSAEEQWRRFCDIEAPTCRAEDVCHCRTAARCFADWSQMPYEEGGAK